MRALFTPPVNRAAGRGRQPRYGEREPTPEATLHRATTSQHLTVVVRGRTIPLTATVTGPWLIQGVPFQPLALIVSCGIDLERGVTRRQRDPRSCLVTLGLTQDDECVLPLPLAELLARASRHWEVEVMHRVLKSGFGLARRQSLGDQGIATVIPWPVRLYALLILTGYRTWGLGPWPVPDLGRWYAARRRQTGRLRQGLQQESWHLGEFQPGWVRSPNTWAEIAAWVQTQTTAIAGARPI